LTGNSNTLAPYGQALELKMTKSPLTLRPSTMPSPSIGAASRRHRPAARGFTLIELMVSISIMAIIALAFGGLMTQANLVVTQGEKRMRSDATASAISRIIRGDIRKITKNGFLHVEKERMVMVTAGRTLSSFSENSGGELVVGDGAIIVYGLQDEILYRKILVLAKGHTEADTLDMSLAEVQVMTPEEITSAINTHGKPPGDMAYPPTTLKQLMSSMWVVLAGNCENIFVYCQLPDGDSWVRDAVCTRHDQTVWPDAIKFTFELKPENIISSAIVGDEVTDENSFYEIVCPVGH
jgi:prepilin-type N-terminal cleavage/methylation domain-containing protein